MPGLTPNYGFRIPNADGTDFIIPDDVRIPVTSIDTALKTVSDTTNSNNTALDARLDVLDTNAVAAGDTLTGAAALAIASGWTIGAGVNLYRRGKFVQFTATVTRTGGAIAGTSDGNIGNITIGTITAGFRPVWDIGVSTRGVGPIWAGYVNASTGIFGIAALAPGYTMPNGTVLTCGTFWMIP